MNVNIYTAPWIIYFFIYLTWFDLAMLSCNFPLMMRYKVESLKVTLKNEMQVEWGFTLPYCTVQRALSWPETRWHWHYSQWWFLNTTEMQCQGLKVTSTVRLVRCWNPDGNSRHQVQEVIKKIPFGVSKGFPEQSAEWVLAYCCWKCLLTDTGHDGWHAADCFDWSVA